MDDLISVVIAIYNKENTINRCVESIIQQTYKKIEILLVNDGSKDNSLKICRQWEQKDKRVRVITKKNEGVSSARNLGINNANGKYILFIDADDFLCNNMIEKLYQNLYINKVELSMCNYSIIRSNKKKQIDLDEDIIFFNRLEFYKNISKYQGFCWNKLFVLDKVKKIMFDEKIHYCEDLLFCVKYNETITKSCYTNLKLYNYVLDNNNFTAQKWNERKTTILDAYKQILEITKKIDKEIYKKFYISYFVFYNEINHLYDNNKNKDEVKKTYKNLKNYALNKKEKFIVFCKYRLFYLYLIVRWLYHNILGR